MPAALLLRIAFPLALVFSGLFVWLTKNEKKDTNNTWRDDSLDDWRREREAQIEAERASQVEQTTGQAKEARQEEHITRIGG